MTKQRQRKSLKCEQLYRPDPAQLAASAVLLGTGGPQGEPDALAVQTTEP